VDYASRTIRDGSGAHGFVIPVSVERDGPSVDVFMSLTLPGGRSISVEVDMVPMRGKFQLLENGETEFGPGDPGYLGGRWWEDTNGNGVQDATDHYFHCPLLGPGRESP
jgi:hypothetical protein